MSDFSGEVPGLEQPLIEVEPPSDDKKARIMAGGLAVFTFVGGAYFCYEAIANEDPKPVVVDAGWHGKETVTVACDGQVTIIWTNPDEDWNSGTADLTITDHSTEPDTVATREDAEPGQSVEMDGMLIGHEITAVADFSADPADDKQPKEFVVPGKPDNCLESTVPTTDGTLPPDTVPDTEVPPTEPPKDTTPDTTDNSTTTTSTTVDIGEPPFITTTTENRPPKSTIPPTENIKDQRLDKLAILIEKSRLA